MGTQSALKDCYPNSIHSPPPLQIMTFTGRKAGKQYSSLFNKRRSYGPAARKARLQAQMDKANAYAAACARWDADNA